MEKYPIKTGTILIISKDHLPCHAAGLGVYLDEFITIKKKVYRFLQEQYHDKVIFFEHGIVGQTIPHAHLHCIPTNSTLHQTTSQENPYNQIIDYSDLPKVYQSFKEYYLLEEDCVVHVYKPTLKVKGYFRIKLAESLHRPELADWHSFNDTNLLQSTQELRQNWQTHH